MGEEEEGKLREEEEEFVRRYSSKVDIQGVGLSKGQGTGIFFFSNKIRQNLNILVIYMKMFFKKIPNSIFLVFIIGEEEKIHSKQIQGHNLLLYS